MDEGSKRLCTLEIGGATARLTFDRAEQRNAFSTDLLRAAHARLDDLEQILGEGSREHDRLRVLVVSGAEPCFAAGMDLKEVIIEHSGPDLPGELLASLGRLALRLRSLPLVTVARVNGAAIGGGCGLACACDIAVSHAGAKVGFPEVDLGLCPAVVAPILVRKIGAGPARRVLLLGGVLTGERAHELGLIDELAPSREMLDDTLSTVVERLASGGPEALAATKGLLNQLDGSLDEDLVRRGAELSARVLATDEAQAALKARL